MRTYEILDAEGNVLHTQEMDDSVAPVLYAGQSARLLALNGDTLSRASRVAVGPDAPPLPDPAALETEASRKSQSSRESLRDSADFAEAAARRSAARVSKAAKAEDAAASADPTPDAPKGKRTASGGA